jgi:hypothetical protein
MKKLMISSILVAFLAAGSIIVAQDRQEDYLGLPGDNLNLYGVMKIFQESKTLEDFERSLNDKNSNINNLDLNGDNYVDYIRVFDNIDGDVHNIVLQVSVNERENQDVAVFTVQRFNNGQVMIQLTGDEELYGKNYIIEPIFDDGNQRETPNPGYTGNNGTNYGRNITVVRTTPFEIALWPVIRFMYLPNYSPWHSSWYWNYYPSYWNPWEPYYYHYYYGYQYNWYNDYYGHYRRWDTHRYDRWNDFYYTSRRSHSLYVDQRLQGGNYKNTYSRPEQRRDGEALFVKTNPDKSRRSPVNSTEGQVRRADPWSAKDNTGATRRSNSNVTNKSVKNPQPGQTTGTTRRPVATETRKSEANPAAGQTTGTTRRPVATETRKSEANPAAGQNTGTTRRPAATETRKSEANPAAGQNTGTTRRPAATETNKSVANKSSERNVGTARTSAQSKASVTSRAASRSSKTQKAATTVKPVKKAEEPVVKKEKRR